MKYDIVTIGDASEDVFIRPTEMKVSASRSVISGKTISFELGEKIPIEDVNYDVGGSAANVAVGLARLGRKALIVTAIGKDSPGDKIWRRLEDEGIGTGNINVKESNKTNFAVIINTEDGERTILVYHGIDYRNLKVKKSLKSRWVFLAPLGQESDDIFKNAISLVSEGGTKLVWNPGAYQIRQGVSKYRQVLENTSILFVNREEAVKFMDYPVRPTDEELMKKLNYLGAKIVVMTKGKEGAKAYDGYIYYKIDIIKDAKRVDATGAGDSFASGFLAKILSIPTGRQQIIDKELISEALKYGIVNSTSVVTQIGAEKGLLTLSGIEAMISSHPRLQAEVYS